MNYAILDRGGEYAIIGTDHTDNLVYRVVIPDAGTNKEFVGKLVEKLNRDDLKTDVSEKTVFHDNFPGESMVYHYDGVQSPAVIMKWIRERGGEVKFDPFSQVLHISVDSPSMISFITVGEGDTVVYRKDRGFWVESANGK